MAKQKVDSGDSVRVGESPVPGMTLRCLCQGHEGAISRIAWSPSGQMIASASYDKTIRIWNAETGYCVAVLKGHRQAVYSVAWSPSGEVLASGSRDRTVRLWDVSSVKSKLADRDSNLNEIKAFQTLRGHHNGVEVVEWLDDDGNTLISSAGNQSFWIWDIRNNTVIEELEHRSGNYYDDVLLSLAKSPDGKKFVSLVASSNVNSYLWNIYSDNNCKASKYQVQELDETTYGLCAAWSPDGQTIVIGTGEDVVNVLNVREKTRIFSLEGHTGDITSLSFSFDGELLASKGQDNTVRLWSTSNWSTVAKIQEKTPDVHREAWSGSLKFHPFLPILATLGEHHQVIRIWELDISQLLAQAGKSRTIRYTSAKIVLVGESNIGKSCLAMRLAEDRYPEDHQQGTTHGMRFWAMEAEQLYPSVKPPEGQRRDLVLWDMGGQDEYRLIHQLFLHDTTLALIVIDPTRRRAAYDEARDWNKRLEKCLGDRQTVKLLVGSKQDKPSKLVDKAALDSLRKECGFSGYYEVSAKTGRNIQSLRRAIAKALNWDNLAKTSRPELFQRIRDEIDTRRKSGQIVLLLDELKSVIREANPEDFDPAAVEAVSDQLATQGVIARTKLSTGEQTLVLQLPIIERYAGSLIVAARNNSRGVPALEERLLGAPELPLPGMTKKDRVDRLQERVVLECIAELMIQHGICFRHEGLLIFPSLFPDTSADSDEKIPHSVSLYYDFTGAIDNIYASLVAYLVISAEFGEGRLWPNRVEFDEPGKGICGIRQIKRTGGLAHIDLFFAEETEQDRRNLFIRFVEDHLRRHGVEIKEHQAIKCRVCSYEIGEDVVQENMARGEKDVICPKCRTLTLISEGVATIRERDSESDQKIYALRKEVEKRTAQAAEKAKQAVSAETTAASQTDEPIRLLHISDLHFTKDTSPATKLQWLLQDIRKGEFLGFDTVEYLVISGDMTHKGREEGFETAREFVSSLIEELGLSAQRCIFVPGNHDVQDITNSYDWCPSVDGLKPDKYVKQGEIYLVRNEEKYPLRLKKFSDAFFHKIVQSPYPLDSDKQGIAYLFPDTRIQFLTLNSCWQIDQFHRRDASVNTTAVAHVIAEAEKQIKDAVERGELKKNQPILRFAVWHHAVAGRWMMQDMDFISHLQNNGVKVFLHGDVHEMRREQIGYWHEKNVHVIGTGSFGSLAEGRPEATPRLYNLLEIQKDLSSIRVHTRQQRQPDGAWEGWYEWPDPDGGAGRVPYFDIPLG